MDFDLDAEPESGNERKLFSKFVLDLEFIQGASVDVTEVIVGDD